MAGVGGAAVALADQAHNTLDGSTDATAEVLSLNSGGSGTTSISISETGTQQAVGVDGDVEKNCNVKENAPLVIDLSSSNPDVTVSPAQLTFTKCANPTNAFAQTITVFAAAANEGAYSGDITATKNGASTAPGTFDLSGVKFTVNVAAKQVTNNAPVVTISGVNNSATYSKGIDPTPAPACVRTDAEDGDLTESITPTLEGEYASDGIGTFTASCTYTDTGGLTASASVTYYVIDPSAPSVGYTLNPTEPNGNNGWFISNVALTWLVADGDSTVTKDGCANQSITADQVETTYGCSATSAGGTTGPETVAVKRDATVPGFDCDDEDGPTDWVNDNVIVDCAASDATSGLADKTNDASFSLSTSVADNSYDQTADTGSRDVYDIAGNKATAGVFTFKVDKQDPVAVCTGAASDLTTWFASNQTVSCTATDGGSGLTAAAAAFSLATNVAEGAETPNASTGTKTVKDNVLNESNAVGPYTFNIDRKAPSVSCDRGSDTTTWHATDQTVSCTTTDGGSGPLAADEKFTLSTNVPVSDAGTYSTGTHAAEDNVGNTAATTGPFSFKVDKASPVVIPDCPPTITLGQTISVPYDSTDVGSGVKAGTGSGSVTYTATTVGLQTISVPAGVATDNVGNTSAATSCPTHVVYKFAGFFQPIDNNGVFNKAKAGSAIPVKFTLGGDQGLDIFATGSPSSQQVNCTTGAVEDLIESTETAGSSVLKYDSASGQYNYVWKTQTGWAGTCRKLTVAFNDGLTTKTALFKLTK